MKKIKVSLVIIVVIAIAIFVIRSWEKITEINENSQIENQFIKRIEYEIDSLSKFPDNKFCKNFYEEISYHIEDDYENGRLGKNSLENAQWKEILSKNLYAAYADKFIKQAFYIFMRSEWKTTDLNFIREESKMLKKSPYLEFGSPVDDSFEKIQQILSKYDEIERFISDCYSFSYSDYSLLFAHFPISEVENKISRANAYLNNNLENNYVNNCTRLHDQLKAIPQVLFNAHVTYLDNKITHWSGLYSNYNSESAFVNNLYNPLKNEINALNNDIYKVPNFDNEYNKLLDKLNSDRKNAHIFFNS